jgi:hypothetical protein
MAICLVLRTKSIYDQFKRKSRVATMFNLLAEQWRLENSTRHKQNKSQALLDILQRQIRGVDVNPDACRITAFSLYLALFEKLRPIDVDEFKEKVRHEEFLPPLLWDKDSAEPRPDTPVVIRGDFLKDELPLEDDFNLVIGNPPWESRGDKQIALHFAKRSLNFLRHGGIGCLLLPSTILVNRNGTLDGESRTTNPEVKRDFGKRLKESRKQHNATMGHLVTCADFATSNLIASTSLNPPPCGTGVGLRR